MSASAFSYALDAGLTDPTEKLIFLCIGDQSCEGVAALELSNIAEWACTSEEVALYGLRTLADKRLITFIQDDKMLKYEISISALRAQASWAREASREPIPLKLRYEVYKKYDDYCTYCHVRFRGDKTIDHVIPVSRGGSNDIENLVVCCRSCNSTKGVKSLEELGWCV